MTSLFSHASHGGSSCAVASEKGEDWRSRALCLKYDPELFFPLGVGSQAQSQADEAKRVCLRCPVRAECLTEATDSGPEFGVWGGTSEEERTGVASRRSQYERAQNVQNEGKDFAMDHGADLLVAVSSGRDPEQAGQQLGLRPAVVRHALRILVPERGKPNRTALERILVDPRVREMHEDGESNWTIAKTVGTQPFTVEEALRVLAQRDAAAARIDAGLAQMIGAVA